MTACDQTLSICVGALATSLTSIVIAIGAYLKKEKR
jgi:hypothetical protein